MFITDVFGLIIAFLNVITFLLLIYLLLQTISNDRSKVLGVLDKVFSPVLQPLRKVLPSWRIDISPAILALVLQIAAAVIKRM
ncbi:MAG: YggT family protein [Candidatus Krumholzibacteria bacterium]|nr:YggT family protein [Candidatus Krumholzibacteria bacterium]